MKRCYVFVARGIPRDNENTTRARMTFKWLDGCREGLIGIYPIKKRYSYVAFETELQAMMARDKGLIATRTFSIIHLAGIGDDGRTLNVLGAVE